MKKEILYIVEFLSKNADVHLQEPYLSMLNTLDTLEIYTPSKYTQEQLKSIMLRANMPLLSSFDETVKLLDKSLETSLPAEITNMKKQIFITLLRANFPKKKAFLEHSLEFFITQLEPVEKQIFDNLLSYIVGLNRAFGLFYLLSSKENSLSTPEHFIAYGNALHVKLFDIIYNKEEQALLDNALKELLGVYLSLYGKYLYM